jgi:lipoprotein-anchoring transpeptidase ErfK/SrfK
MRHLWLFSIAASATLGFCGAAAAEPLVIPGIGPESAPVHAPPSIAPQPQQTQQVQAGAYGGGFLELLITGRDPTSRSEAATYRPPEPQATTPIAVPHAAASPRLAPAAPLVRQASYSAPPAVSAGVHRPVDPVFAKQEVDYDGPEAAGTVIVDTPHKFLFLVLGNGRALRYGIGVGRPGFEWAGVKTITRKAEWPGWTPPSEMLLRQPNLPRHMDGGPDNPLGARALYLGSSLYRIHGTNEPSTIGKDVSSGCIRMMNADVMDLYDRVKVGTKVVVL